MPKADTVNLKQFLSFVQHCVVARKHASECKFVEKFLPRRSKNSLIIIDLYVFSDGHRVHQAPLAVGLATALSVAFRNYISRLRIFLKIMSLLYLAQRATGCNILRAARNSGCRAT